MDNIILKVHKAKLYEDDYCMLSQSFEERVIN